MSAKVTAAGIMSLLEKQGYRCALTGRILKPEEANLDHRQPVSRGGAHEMGNLQVIHSDVNRAKNTLTQAEFIELCREVVAHADQMGQRESA